jgi:hypothetical protein
MREVFYKNLAMIHDKIPIKLGIERNFLNLMKSKTL